MTQPAPGAQSGTGDTQSVDPTGTGTGTSTETDTGTQSDPAGQTTTQTPPGQSARETELAAQLEQTRARMQQADKRAADFESKLRQLTDKDLPEIDKLKRDFEGAAARAEKAEADLASARLQIAFLSDNTNEWHDPQAALKLADLKGVDIDKETGVVSGLRQALDALAKANPWLVKPKADGDSSGTAGGPPGTPPANNGSSGNGKPDSKDLARRFPGMRSRLG